MNKIDLIHIAYKELVEIEPTSTIPDIHLLTTSITDISPLSIIKVPLYIALSLHNSSSCKIKLPSMLRAESLLAVIEFEKENQEEFYKLHPHFFELSEILIGLCVDVDDNNTLKMGVQEIRELRGSKIKEGLEKLDGKAFNMNGLTAFEFSGIREFVIGVSEKARKMLNLNEN